MSSFEFGRRGRAILFKWIRRLNCRWHLSLRLRRSLRHPPHWGAGHRRRHAGVGLLPGDDLTAAT